MSIYGKIFKHDWKAICHLAAKDYGHEAHHRGRTLQPPNSAMAVRVHWPAPDPVLGASCTGIHSILLHTTEAETVNTQRMKQAGRGEATEPKSHSRKVQNQIVRWTSQSAEAANRLGHCSALQRESGRQKERRGPAMPSSMGCTIPLRQHYTQCSADDAAWDARIPYQSLSSVTVRRQGTGRRKRVNKTHLIRDFYPEYIKNSARSTIRNRTTRLRNRPRTVTNFSSKKT